MTDFPNRITVNRYDLEHVLRLALLTEDRDKDETKALLRIAATLDGDMNKGTRWNIGERKAAPPTEYLWEVGAPVPKALAERWQRTVDRYFVAVELLREERQRRLDAALDEILPPPHLRAVGTECAGTD